MDALCLVELGRHDTITVNVLVLGFLGWIGFHATLSKFSLLLLANRALTSGLLSQLLQLMMRKNGRLVALLE